MKNSTENTPAHCHGCHQFADCRKAQNMVANTKPVEGWIYGGEVYCDNCLGDVNPSASAMGEWDNPIHCDGCGVPILHDLTAEGVAYVSAVLRNGGGCCRELWPVVWADYLKIIVGVGT